MRNDLRFLVVDDHMLMRKLVSHQLNTLGFTDIEKAINGEDAYNKIKDSYQDDNLYDVVIADWSMPILDGMGLLKKCKSDERFSSIIFIMLTGESEASSILTALEEGASSYIVKPVTHEVFKEKIDSILKSMEEQDSSTKDEEKEKYSKDIDDENSNQEKNENKDLNFDDQLKEELIDVVNQAVSNTFVTMFGENIAEVSEMDINASQDVLMCHTVFYQGDRKSEMYFCFDENLIKSLLLYLYPHEMLEDKSSYDDAAKEIANIIFFNVKSFLNGKGYNVNMDIPIISNTQDINDDSSIRIGFHMKMTPDEVADIANRF